MAYTMTTEQWYKKMGRDQWGEPLDHETKVRPTPMRPISDRMCYETEHFVVMYAITNKWGGRQAALIERACSSTPITRIDKRLKSVKRIIRQHRVPQYKHVNWVRAHRRHLNELIALADKCEHLYPCHFMLKGVDYAKELPRDTAQA